MKLSKLFGSFIFLYYLCSVIKNKTIMKYKVKDLLNKNNMVGHLFLDCIDSDTVTEIIKQDGYDYNTTEIDIKLLVNDKELNIQNFLEHLEDEYFKQIKKCADSLVKKMLSNKADEISGMLTELKNKLEHIENNIEWDENLIDYDTKRNA